MHALIELLGEIFAIILTIGIFFVCYGIKTLCPNCGESFYFQHKTCPGCGYEYYLSDDESNSEIAGDPAVEVEDQSSDQNE